MDIYYNTPEYAREHGELDKYRGTRNAIDICTKDIETILSARFDGMHLDSVCLSEITTLHGFDLVALALSSTIIDKEYDGRFSQSNKDWAHTIKQVNMRARTIETHPTILNGFVTLFRKGLQK